MSALAEDEIDRLRARVAELERELEEESARLMECTRLLCGQSDTAAGIRRLRDDRNALRDLVAKLECERFADAGAEWRAAARATITSEDDPQPRCLFEYMDKRDAEVDRLTAERDALHRFASELETVLDDVLADRRRFTAWCAAWKALAKRYRLEWRQWQSAAGELALKSQAHQSESDRSRELASELETELDEVLAERRRFAAWCAAWKALAKHLREEIDIARPVWHEGAPSDLLPGMLVDVQWDGGDSYHYMITGRSWDMNSVPYEDEGKIVRWAQLPYPETP